MPIPENKLFEDFLSNTKLVTDKPEKNFEVFSEPRFHPMDVNPTPSVYLSYPEAELKLGSVLKCIISDMSHRGSPVNPQIASTVLGLIVETKDGADSHVDHANRILKEVTAAKLYMHEIFDRYLDPEYQVKVQSLEIKSFRNRVSEEKILWWAERGNSSFPPQVLSKIDGKTTLRSVEEIKIVDWMAKHLYSKLMNKWGPAMGISLIDEYYFQAFMHTRKTYSLKFKDELSLLEAGGLDRFDFEGLSNSVLCNKLGLFSWKNENTNRAWALCGLSDSPLNLPPPDKYKCCEVWLKEEFSFTGFTPDKPLDNSIQKYCKILQRAEWHGSDGREDEEFLFRVIALDLLFSDRAESGQIAKRSALLTHNQLNSSFDELSKKVKKLYDIRSKFVHEGKLPELAESVLLKKICRETLWCLLYISGQNLYHSVDQWLDEIDFLSHTLKTERVPEEPSLIRIGIPPFGENRTPPYAVNDDQHRLNPFLSELADHS